MEDNSKIQREIGKCCLSSDLLRSICCVLFRSQYKSFCYLGGRGRHYFHLDVFFSAPLTPASCWLFFLDMLCLFSVNWPWCICIFESWDVLVHSWTGSQLRCVIFLFTVQCSCSIYVCRCGCIDDTPTWTLVHATVKCHYLQHKIDLNLIYWWMCLHKHPTSISKWIKGKPIFGIELVCMFVCVLLHYFDVMSSLLMFPSSRWCVYLRLFHKTRVCVWICSANVNGSTA